MAYSELIKKLEKTREYVRRFYVFGFWHRDQYDIRSARSYDNERRRVESWMSDYVTSRREAAGKVVYLSVDGRTILHNPLYHMFKAKSFTSNDITLHFYLMDILAKGDAMAIGEILEQITHRYFVKFKTHHVLEESTLRKKLKEYEKLGLIRSIKCGNKLLYQRTDVDISLEQWAEAFAFYSEMNPLGVIGSFLLDKLKNVPDYFQFKHRFLLHTLDGEILSRILDSICEQAEIKLVMRVADGESKPFVVHPMKIYVSTQNGRQYLLAWDDVLDRPWFYRLDNILKAEKEKRFMMQKAELQNTEAKVRNAEEDMKAKEEELAKSYAKKYESVKDKIWGVSLGDYATMEHIEMKIFAEPHEYFIGQRLEREKRCGTVEKIDENTYLFRADVYDAKELLPWIRTFIGRIVSLECSNPAILEKFSRELQELNEIYGGEGYDI